MLSVFIMAGSRRSALSVQQRLEILKDLETLPLSTVAAKYSVNPVTIRRVKKNAASITEFAKNNILERKRQRLRKPLYEELEHHLFTWFREKRMLGDVVTDALLLEKAAELKENIPSTSDFKVSKGWLAKFKKRHSIRLMHLHGDKDNDIDEDAAKLFVDNFNKLIQEENIHIENIYNMNESGLLWKAVPTKTVLAVHVEKCISDYKIRKDRITVGLCTNATGSNKIMPLIIYKYQNPRALQDCNADKIPVIFKSRANTGMDQLLFTDWFENHFKPKVRMYQLQKQIYGKVILLVDNCQKHKVQTDIEDDFKIIYLPSNTATLIQPMDQGIIQKTKRLFRHKILQSVLKYDGRVNEFYNNYTIKDCIDILHEAWTQVSAYDIKNAWKNIMTPMIPIENVEETEERSRFQRDLYNYISIINGQQPTEEDVIKFLSVCEEEERPKCLQQEEIQNEYEEEEEEEEEDEEENTNDSEDEDVKENIKYCENEDVKEQNVNENENKDIKKENINYIEIQDIKEENTNDNETENITEEKIIINQQEENRNNRSELQYLFDRLMFHSATAPHHIQLMVEGLRMFFLDNK